jgi:hypothetical protein
MTRGDYLSMWFVLANLMIVATPFGCGTAAYWICRATKSETFGWVVIGVLAGLSVSWFVFIPMARALALEMA